MNDRFKCFPLMIVPRYELLNPGPPVTDEVDPEPDSDATGSPVGASYLHLVRPDEEDLRVD